MPSDFSLITLHYCNKGISFTPTYGSILRDNIYIYIYIYYVVRTARGRGTAGIEGCTVQGIQPGRGRRRRNKRTARQRIVGCLK